MYYSLSIISFNYFVIDKELDDSDKVKLPSFEYDGGNDINPTEQLGDGDFAETQELDYGNYFDDPLHPSFKQSVVISKPVVSKIETVVIPGIGRESTTSVDKNFQKLKSLSEYNLGQTACRSVLNSVSRKLDALLNMHADNPRPTTTQQANVLPNFPISSYEDLAKFNQLLVDKEIARTQYEDLIKQRRNTDGKKCIRSVLGFILTDELCCKLSWSGQKKTIKVEKNVFRGAFERHGGF
ncbi:hypothetical protein NQ314_002100 [Rhamnusium bicolor]|uniref:DUF4806 domain-containing protein n=1 Tax=Rhamnusium bicolor TaxID=1586634 RepID=A0AAV8ZS66_9CUCU|nr:hypothetical protein NQ314_002100 [Rhamnusium bicolor]